MGAGADDVSFTEANAAVDVYMITDFRTFADFHIVGYDRVGADFHPVGDLRSGMNDGCRMMHEQDFFRGAGRQVRSEAIPNT